ncbi:MAG TPA: hypothetical protein VJU84_21675 [Pyrinomonadaceae bacterium]|nr:hypothetical protein [Pyrinomonadaceae bacterium]
MPDILVKSYLYFLVGSSVILFLLYGIITLVERYHSRKFLVKAKYLWRNLFGLITGIVGAYLFASGLLGNSLVLLVTLVMIFIGTIASELIERVSSKRGHNVSTT